MVPITIPYFVDTDPHSPSTVTRCPESPESPSAGFPNDLANDLSLHGALQMYPHANLQCSDSPTWRGQVLGTASQLYSESQVMKNRSDHHTAIAAKHFLSEKVAEQGGRPMTQFSARKGKPITIPDQLYHAPSATSFTKLCPIPVIA